MLVTNFRAVVIAIGGTALLGTLRALQVEELAGIEVIIRTITSSMSNRTQSLALALLHPVA